MTKSLHSYIAVCRYDNGIKTYFGPFHSILEAETWINNQPDDEDLMEMWVATMNSPELSDNNN